MRGHLVKRGKSSWSIVLSLSRDPVTGKKRQQWVSVKGTKRVAEAKLAELLHQIDTGGYVPPVKATFGEFIEKWLETYAATHVRACTLAGYRDRAKHIVAALGPILLQELRADHLHGYFAEKGKNLAPGTLAKHYNLIRSALGHAVKWGLVVRNVAEAVDPPRPSRREPTILRAEDVERFLTAAREHYLYPLYHTLLWTGLRRSEALGLRWEDIDLTMGTLRVVRVLHQLRNGSFEFNEPKTPTSRRQIALSPASCVTLREWKAKQQALGLPVKGESLVFCRLHDGSPLCPAVVTHVCSKLVKRAGLPHLRLHDLRHSHASLLLLQNVSPKVVSERLGHANVGFTLTTYSHTIPALQEQAAREFDRVVARATENT